LTVFGIGPVMLDCCWKAGSG